MRHKLSNYALLKKLLASVPIGDSCMEWPAGRNEKGYGRIRYKGIDTYVHRVSNEMADGPIPDGIEVLHHCDNPPCFRQNHLFRGTQVDNLADCAKKRRMKYGKDHHAVSLSEDQVREIRKLRGIPQSAIASRFGVGQATVCRIRNRITWKYLAD